jgi:hypothetical protein
MLISITFIYVTTNLTYLFYYLLRRVFDIEMTKIEFLLWISQVCTYFLIILKAFVFGYFNSDIRSSMRKLSEINVKK